MGLPVENILVPAQSDSEIYRSVREVLPEGPWTDVAVINEALLTLSNRLGKEVFAVALDLAFHISFNSRQAQIHWNKMMEHHDELCRKLDAGIDFRVSALDYLTRKAKVLVNPTMLESEEFLRIRQDTMTDGMTGLYNFRHFRRMLEREIAQSERTSAPLSLLFFDVDHFKKFNDIHGHQVGDEVLRRVAGVIARTVRTSDIPCRYGGEEFAVLAPGTAKPGAALLAERIRSGVEKVEIPGLRKLGSRITISGGVASYREDAQNIEMLIHRADEALYAAKRNGRNRIESRQGIRRCETRHPLEIPGTYGIVPKQREPISTRNLSPGGFLFKSSHPLSPGSTVRFELRIPAQDGPVSCLGKISHLKESDSSDAYLIGVSIVRMSESDQSRYRGFIASVR